MTFKRVGEQTDILGESPIWNEDEQALYWVDIRHPAVRRLDHASGRIDTWTMPGMVGSIVFADDGRLAIALADRVDLFDRSSGAFEPVAKLGTAIPDHRFNDGRVDRQGRFWVGTMHNITRAPEGVLYRLDPGRGLVGVLSEICIPNSLAWSPDGATMYFADSLLYTIFAYAFDTASGTMGTSGSSPGRRRPVFPTARRSMPRATSGTPSSTPRASFAMRRRAKSIASSKFRWPARPAAPSAVPASTSSTSRRPART